MDQRLGVVGVVLAAALVWTAALVIAGDRRGAWNRPVSDQGPVHRSMTQAAGPAPAHAMTPGGPVPNKVGILAGHWQYDSGAVCPDGLKEVDVTTDVALRVQALLDARGISAEILPEHDPDVPQAPLLGYRAAAMVALHADSCASGGASGFKAARWTHSRTPEADDRLIECLEREYGLATGLSVHAATITADMTHYYALREIGPDTPGVILELGFLDGDRRLFDANRYEMAKGVAAGIACFLNAESSGTGG